MADEVQIILRALGVESIDQAKLKIQELQSATDGYKNSAQQADRKSLGLIDRLTKLKTGALAARLGIIALTLAIVNFLKTSVDMAKESAIVQHQMLGQLQIIKEQDRAWGRLKESVGGALINFRAEVILRRQSIDLLREEVEWQKLSQKERSILIEQKKEELLLDAEKRAEEEARQEQIKIDVELKKKQREAQEELNEKEKEHIELLKKEQEEMKKLQQANLDFIRGIASQGGRISGTGIEFKAGQTIDQEQLKSNLKKLRDGST